MATKRPGLRRRGVVALVAAAGLVAAACSNATETDTANKSAGPTGTSMPKGAGTTQVADLSEKVPLPDVPGVTDDAINYSVIGTRSNNPLGTCILDCFADGVKAYFAYRNDQGGIWGRKLAVTTELDDELGQNQVKALEVTTANDTFGNFNAATIGNGWATLSDAGFPTYVWMIHPNDMAGKTNIWGNREVVCITCYQRWVAWVAKQAGAKKIASLGYGISDDSKLCSQAQVESVKKYGKDVGGAEVAYSNDQLMFGLPNGIAPEVTAMKDAGVDLIMGCLDLNGMKTLAQELDRQGMGSVPMMHNNTYDQEFVKKAGDLFVGDYINAGFRPFEADPGSSGLAAYKEWMGKAGKPLSELAYDGWINADTAYQGLKAAGPNFDRQKVIDATNAMTAYTAGGLIQPIDWTRQHQPPTKEDPATHGPKYDCFSYIKVGKDGTFEMQGDKSKPWTCWPGGTWDWSEPQSMDFE